MICPNCNATVPDGFKFCENCGTPLPDVAAQTQVAPAQDTSAEPAQEATAAPAAEPVQAEAPPAADPYAAAQGAAAAPAAEPYAAAQADPQQTYAAPAAGPYATANQQTYGTAGQYGAPGQYNQPPMQPGQAPYGAPQQPQGSNTPFVLAIIALVTAILGLFPVSIVLGIIALVMNNKQKKQGIVTTKQTPTFVMSLISLILSAIMLIATIALGGMLWGAIASGQLNTSGGSVSVTSNSSGTSVSVSNTSSSASASSTSAASSGSAASTAQSGDFAGMWQLDSMKSSGQAVSSSDIDKMREMGLDVTLELKSDGTATFVLFDQKMNGTWSSSGSTGITLTIQGEAIPLTYDGTLLTMEADGDWLAFRKA